MGHRSPSSLLRLAAIPVVLLYVALRAPGVHCTGLTEETAVISALTGNASFVVIGAILSQYSSQLSLADGKPRTIFVPTTNEVANQYYTYNESYRLELLAYHMIDEYINRTSMIQIREVYMYNAKPYVSQQGTNITLSSAFGGPKQDQLAVTLAVYGKGEVQTASVSIIDFFTTGVTIIQGIDTLLTPPLYPPPPPPPPNAAPPPPKNYTADIFAALSGNDNANYTIMRELVTAFATQLKLGDGSSRTIFAPSDLAWNVAALDTTNVSLIFEILSYHVVPVYLNESLIEDKVVEDSTFNVTTLQGQILTITNTSGAIFINNATLDDPNLTADGVSVVHGIDEVLLPFSKALLTPLAPVNGTAEEGKIVTTLAAAGSYATLLALVTPLITSLNLTNGENKTIFCPTNAAFTLLNLTSISSAELLSILKYHIVPEVIPYKTLITDLADSDGNASLTTQQGSKLFLTLDANNDIFIGGAPFESYNLLVDNNTVLHGIDKVLIPASLAKDVQVYTPSPPPPPSSGALGSFIRLRDNSLLFTVMLGVGLLFLLAL
eukprot:TRINITY_DN33067_c0_g1_i1.p1 TRINITY_DN33067_c0_g1~~TRINITY_DN33067_c0_g1_i1.p1  ORF type:complete len:550 (-),score=45.50 TRINITY_DN33067_c0_g1_i1:766-2415(-)